ncbi:MAG: DUF1579 domain-containing protein [Armatimonadota bacterium]
MDTSTTQQDSMMKVEPQSEHQWLQKFVGEWTFEGEVEMEPGKPVEKFNGTESVRSIGGIWIVGEGKIDVPGDTPMTMITTIGYDPQKKRFVGSFIMSMTTYLWVYDGELDANEKVLTLNSEGPVSNGKITKSKDITEFIDNDHRVLRSQILGEDGQWHEVMKSSYQRIK